MKSFSFLPLFNRWGISQEIYEKIAERLYLVAISLVFTIAYAQDFDRSGIIRPIIDLIHPVAIIFLLILVKYIFFQSYNILRLIVIAIAGCITSLCLIYGHTTSIIELFLFLFLFSAEYVKFNNIVRVHLSLFSLWVGYMLIYCTLTGTLIGTVEEYGGVNTISFFGMNPNWTGLILYIIFSEILYLFGKKHLVLIHFISIVFIGIDFFLISCLTSVAAILGLTILFDIYNTSYLSAKMKNIGLLILSIFSAIISIMYFIVPYNINILDYEMFNRAGFFRRLIGTRAFYNYGVLQEYSPWTLFGNSVDSNYLQIIYSRKIHSHSLLTTLFVDYGLLWSVFILVCLAILMYKGFRDKNLLFLLVTIIFIFYSNMEPLILSFIYFPIWFAAYPCAQGVDTEYST